MDFKHLLNDSLSISFGGSRIIPPIFRSLDQVESESKSRSKQGASSSSLKNGQFFLAKEGSLHPERLEAQIKDLPKLADTYEPQVYISGTDFERFIKHEEEVLILSLLEESRKAAAQEMARRTLKTREAEWDRQKKKILQSFNAISSDSSFTPKRRMQQTKQQSDLSYSVGSTLRMNPNMHQYASAVIQMNEARSRSSPFNVISTFRNLLDSDASYNQISESWELLSFVLGREATIQNVYAGSYKETYDSQVAMNLRQKFISGAKSFLENQLMKFIEKTIAQQPREASMGGRPGAVDKIKGFLQIRLKQYGRWDSTIEVVDDIPVWALVFYLVRCGYWDDAVKVSMQFENYFEREDPNFITYLKSFKENNDDFRLPKHLRAQIQMDFTQKARQQADRFKLALYKVLGRCDLARKTLNDVITTKEDYMWLQLSLVRETPEVDFAADSYNLMDLRRILSKFGPEHFTSKTANPLNYFQVLLTSFQFESAVAYLYGIEQYRVEAIHFAIALCYYGVLNVFPNPDVFSVELLKIDGGKTMLQLGRIISNYAQGFSKSDPQIAFHYLFSLTLYNSSEYANFCHSLVCNLALETKDFGTYLGTFRTDGTKYHGFLERYLGLLNLRNDSEFYESIVLQAARISENEGHVEDALNLYNLSKDYNSVLSLLCRKLSEFMMKPSDNLGFYQETCSNILGYYESLKTTNVDPVKMDNCRLLLKLVEFFRLFSELKYEGALSAMENMNLVPLDGDTNLLGRKAESLKSLDETVSRHFGDIIVSLMTCIVKLYEGLKHSPYFDSAKQTKMQWLRKKSRVLLTFSGMVPFRMPQEIFAKLNRMDINLG